MLSDLVVVDLTRALAGPHAAMMLADLGARVIKVESPARRRHPRRGDRRSSGPADEPDVDVLPVRATATRSRSPPTSRPTTAGTFLTRLVAHADVLMENFRTGVLDRLGFSVERLHEINPRPGRPVDHRLRARRPRGRPARATTRSPRARPA